MSFRFDRADVGHGVADDPAELGHDRRRMGVEEQSSGRCAVRARKGSLSGGTTSLDRGQRRSPAVRPGFQQSSNGTADHIPTTGPGDGLSLIRMTPALAPAESRMNRANWPKTESGFRRLVDFGPEQGHDAEIIPLRSAPLHRRVREREIIEVLLIVARFGQAVQGFVPEIGIVDLAPRTAFDRARGDSPRNGRPRNACQADLRSARRRSRPGSSISSAALSRCRADRAGRSGSARCCR